MRNCWIVFTTLLLAGAPLMGQAPATEDLWLPLTFLVGEWTGAGSGKPGQGLGDMVIRWDLDKHILVNRSSSSYPATQDHPAFTHASLMIVFKDASRQRLAASYFDNEGHTISYAVNPSADGNSVQFLSEPAPGTPRFRLTYSKAGANSLGIKFEIAPPNKPDSFATYTEGSVNRRPSAKSQR